MKRLERLLVTGTLLYAMAGLCLFSLVMMQDGDARVQVRQDGDARVHVRQDGDARVHVRQDGDARVHVRQDSVSAPAALQAAGASQNTSLCTTEQGVKKTHEEEEMGERGSNVTKASESLNRGFHFGDARLGGVRIFDAHVKIQHDAQWSILMWASIF